MTELTQQLKDIVGSAGYQEGDNIPVGRYRDLMGARKICPALHLRPKTTEEVSQILKLCHQHGQPISPQGGMTGLVSAGAPMEGEISLSLERMNQIVELDPYTSTLTAEAGTPLQVIQEHAAEQGFLFPLDLGARGSCTIGGNLSTNAGGNRVIRYGMARDLVVSLEAVLADGTIIDGTHKLRKNNSGYDLKQLFMGSEGTLGIITKVVLKLLPKPTSQTVAICGTQNFEQVAKLLNHMQTQLSSHLTAFEVVWKNTYDLVSEYVDNVNLPLDASHGFYVLVECMGSQQEHDQVLFQTALESAMEKELIDDAIISQSEKDVRDLWRFRDAPPEVDRKAGRMHSYDISIAVGDMGYFGEEVSVRLKEKWPDALVGLFGHIGDGNLHIIIHVGPDTGKLHTEIDEVIYALIRELNGSVSAEHGIGMMKRPYLQYCKSEAEIELMRTLKKAMDPKNILSPGRIFEV